MRNFNEVQASDFSGFVTKLKEVSVTKVVIPVLVFD